MKKHGWKDKGGKVRRAYKQMLRNGTLREARRKRQWLSVEAKVFIAVAGAVAAFWIAVILMASK